MYRNVTEPILIGFDAQKADKLEGSGRDNPGKDSPPTNPTPTTHPPEYSPKCINGKLFSCWG